MVVKSYIYSLLLALFLPFAASAEGAAHAEHGAEDAGKSPSEIVVEKIMHHIADANEFHIATVGGEHISFPLPCILYSKTTGKISFMMSSQFHHEEVIDGYRMDHGKIVDASTGERNTFIDFSITKNVFQMLLGVVILALIMFSVKSAYAKRGNKAPKGLQSWIEPIVSFLADDVIKPNVGPKYEKFLPFLLSIFFFILINNLLGLVPFFPGSANVSGNIAFTFALAAITFLVINLNGNKSYWGHVLAMPGVPKWVLVILTPVEIAGLFIKPIALMLRLFGNITGGHIAILSIVSLIFIFGEMGKSVGGASLGSAMAIPIVLFVNAMELFVAFLQAYVFTLLSSIFIGAAVEEHHHSEEHH